MIAECPELDLNDQLYQNYSVVWWKTHFNGGVRYTRVSGKIDTYMCKCWDILTLQCAYELY